MASPDAGGGVPAGAAILAAARGLLGTPFRAQGRGVAGVDCLGLVLLACERAGVRIRGPVPAPALRGIALAEAEMQLRSASARRVEVAAPGDVLLARPAVAQVHLAIATGDGVVEAHAGLGRVVERPMVAGEGWLSAWRLPLGGREPGDD